MLALRILLRLALLPLLILIAGWLIRFRLIGFWLIQFWLARLLAVGLVLLRIGFFCRAGWLAVATKLVLPSGVHRRLLTGLSWLLLAGLLLTRWLLTGLLLAVLLLRISGRILIGT